MSTMSETAVTTQVYRIYIKASAQAVWDAITDPEWNEKYGYPGRGEYDLRPGGRYLAAADEQAQAMGMPAELVDGEVLEVDRPRRLAMTFLARWDPELEAEGPVRMTWEIEPSDGGLSRLTVTSANLGRRTAAEFSGGIVFIVSGLKTYLETGSTMTPPPDGAAPEGEPAAAG